MEVTRRDQLVEVFIARLEGEWDVTSQEAKIDIARDLVRLAVETLNCQNEADR